MSLDETSEDLGIGTDMQPMADKFSLPLLKGSYVGYLSALSHGVEAYLLRPA